MVQEQGIIAIFNWEGSKCGRNTGPRLFIMSMPRKEVMGPVVLSFRRAAAGRLQGLDSQLETLKKEQEELNSQWRKEKDEMRGLQSIKEEIDRVRGFEPLQEPTIVAFSCC